MKNIVISVGEPAGIGPDIVLMSMINLIKSDFLKNRIKIIASQKMLQERAKLLGLDFEKLNNQENIEFLDIPTKVPVIPGKLDQANSPYVLTCLKKAAELCEFGGADVLVTGPIHKGIINDSGVKFSGHTEFLRDLAGLDSVVMMLVSPKQNLKVALATTHIPLSAVPNEITPELLIKTCQIISKSFINFKHCFPLTKPLRIGVCGLNPHAGENGHIGREEIEKIIPAIQAIKNLNLGLEIEGPLPADTIFASKIRSKFDLILALYHDQGLAPFKALSFGEGLNITLGLPYLRVSVDHGTALDLAGSGRADPGPFLEVLNFVLGS